MYLEIDNVKFLGFHFVSSSTNYCLLYLHLVTSKLYFGKVLPSSPHFPSGKCNSAISHQMNYRACERLRSHNWDRWQGNQSITQIMPYIGSNNPICFSVCLLESSYYLSTCIYFISYKLHQKYGNLDKNNISTVYTYESFLYCPQMFPYDFSDQRFKLLYLYSQFMNNKQ